MHKNQRLSLSSGFFYIQFSGYFAHALAFFFVTNRCDALDRTFYDAPVKNRSMAVAASMRRPASVNNKIYDRPLWGMAQGGLPSCGGSRRFLAAWGEPARPGFPLRGNGKGGGQFSFLAAAGWFVDSLCAPFLQFLSQPPTRPASIRTLVWSFGSGACWCP